MKKKQSVNAKKQPMKRQSSKQESNKQQSSKQENNWSSFLNNKEAIDTLIGIAAIVLIVVLVKWVATR